MEDCDVDPQMLLLKLEKLVNANQLQISPTFLRCILS